MKPKENGKLILSLFDYSGAWAKPYADAGYAVQLWDLKVEGCILEEFHNILSFLDVAEDSGYKLHGILAAPPCTDFAGSGAKHWAKKDATPPPPDDVWNQVDYSVAYILHTMALVEMYRPQLKFWALENPVGRLETLVPEIKPYRKMLFNPCDYGDPYTKKTILWGEFNTDLPRTPVEPVFVEYKSKSGKLIRMAPQFATTGGKSEKTKAIRSTTPAGFANAFFKANP